MERTTCFQGIIIIRSSTTSPTNPPLEQPSKSNYLSVANETSLGSVVGVDIGAREAQSRVPRIGSGGVLSSRAEGGLGVLAGGVRVVGGTADVDQLVADAVEDDGGVQRLLLALVHDGILGLERELAGLAPVQRLLELDRRRAGAEVEPERRGLEAEEGSRHGVGNGSGADCCAAPRCVAAVPGRGGRGSSSGAGAAASKDGSASGDNGSGGGGSIGIVVAAGITAGTARRGSIDGEVGKALGDHDVGYAEAGGVEGRLERGRRVGVFGIRADDVGIDEGDNASKSLGGGEGGIAADVGDADDEGVEVLLGGHELLCRRDDLGIVTECRYDLVSEGKLGTGIGSGEENAGNRAGQRRSLTGLAKVAQG